MPRYGWDIKELLFEEDVKAIFNKTTNDKESALVALLWLTGARPSELAELRKEKVYYDAQKLTITLVTKKLGEAGAFKLKERTLEFVRLTGLGTNVYIETLIKYVSLLPPEALLLPHTTRWQENVIGRLSLQGIGKKLSPYHFRHSVMSWMAHNGSTINELMHFKGAASILSVSPYMNAKPMIVNIQSQRRSRDTPVIPPEQPKAEVAPPPKEEAQPPPSEKKEEKKDCGGDEADDISLL